MELGHTYYTYNTVAYSVPLAFLVCSPVTIVLLWLEASILSDDCCCSSQPWYEKCFKKVDQFRPWTLVFNMLKQIYGDNLMKVESNVGDHQKKKTEYSLFNRELSKRKMQYLFTALLTIYFCTVVSFWAQLLVDEGSQCDAHMDCFALNGSLVQNSPLKGNCTYYEDNGYIIQCYRFYFNYVDAIGNSGSVIVVGSLVMNMQPFISALALALKGKLGVLAKLGLFLYFAVISLGFFIVPLLAISDAARAVLFPTNKAIVEFCAYYFTFAFAFILPGPVFILELRKWPPWNEAKEYNLREMINSDYRPIL